MFGRPPRLLNDFMNKRVEQKSICLKESLRMNSILDCSDVNCCGSFPFDCSVLKHKCGSNGRSTYDVNVASPSRTGGLDELIQLPYKRYALRNGDHGIRPFLHETESAIDDMKFGPQPVVSIRSRNPADRSMPVDVA